MSHSSPRRRFLQLSGSCLVASASHALVSCGAPSPAPRTPQERRARIRAIAFDAFAIFDPRSIEAVVEGSFPGRGRALTAAWRTRQFEYTWLRVAGHRYADFWDVTESALVYAARASSLELTPAVRARLMDASTELGAWPEVRSVLEALRGEGLRLVLLSNFTPRMLSDASESAGLSGVFEHALSTDRARTYKPDPAAYQLAVDTLSLPREAIAFVAHAGWDAVGAAWFGFPTIWLNRLALPPEGLDPVPHIHVLPDLKRLPEVVRSA